MQTLFRIRAFLVALVVSVFSVAAMSQSFPSKTVEIIVPFSAGGPSDIFARLLSRKLADVWSQSVIVDNKTGATGMIAASFVARSAPDGHTLLMASTSSHVSPALYAKPALNPDKDLAAVIGVVSMPLYLVVNPALPVKDVQELVQLLRKNPGKYSYSSAGNGSVNHLSMELWKSMASLDVAHIPYRGAAPALQAVISGEVAFTFDTVSQADSFVQAGKLKAIAVSGKHRTPSLPNIPTIAESGYPEFTPTIWFGLFVPAKTPAPVIEKINAQVTRSMAAPDIQERLRSLGAEFAPITPAEYQRFANSESVQWRKVISATGTKAD